MSVNDWSQQRPTHRARPRLPLFAAALAAAALAYCGCSAPPAPTAPDTAPVADAGEDVTAAPGQTVVLDGSGSLDPDGDALSFEWTAGTDNPSMVVLSPVAQVSVVPTTPGTYWFHLTVSARGLTSEADSVQVTVAGADAHPPVADAGIDAVLSLQARIYLDGDSSTDADGDSLSYLWELVSGPAPVSITDSTAVQTRVSVAEAGEYLFRLTVSDATFSMADEVRLVVTPEGNVPPVAEAGDNQTVSVGSPVALDGSGSSDPDGSFDLLAFLWRVGRNPGENVLLSDSTIVSPTFTPTLTGQYVFGLVVDDGVSASLQDTVAITVIDQVYDKRSGMIEIPAGPFLMGMAQSGFADDKPEHEVDLSTFWIDSVEVTVSQYQICVNEGICAPAGQGPDCNAAQAGDRGNHPVNCVTWEQANAFCTWANKRLPTEAEWEKAARGVNDHRRFPWGDGDPALLVLANPDLLLVNYNNLYGSTVPVGTHPDGVSPFGAHNMAGNVLEWTADYYDGFYYTVSPRRNPLGPDSGEQRVARGGHYLAPADAATTTVRNRVQPGSADPALGFRCGRTTPPP